MNLNKARSSYNLNQDSPQSQKSDSTLDSPPGPSNVGKQSSSKKSSKKYTPFCLPFKKTKITPLFKKGQQDSSTPINMNVKQNNFMNASVANFEESPDSDRKMLQRDCKRRFSLQPAKKVGYFMPMKQQLSYEDISELDSYKNQSSPQIVSLKELQQRVQNYNISDLKTILNSKNYEKNKKKLSKQTSIKIKKSVQFSDNVEVFQVESLKKYTFKQTYTEEELFKSQYGTQNNCSIF